MRMAKRSRVFATVWTLAVLGAVIVTLPMLALWSMVAFPSAAIGLFSPAPLDLLLSVLWPAAGIAGLIGLVLARSRGPLGLGAIRLRQVLLLAGIGAAAVPLAGFVVEAFASHTVHTFPMVLALAFAVLILQAGADIGRLQALGARLTEPADRVPEWLLGLAVLCALSALSGHLAL